jgi:hypothetical protein
MAPEEQAAFFGGDMIILCFRHDLISFLRAYENDKPAATPNYFKWSEKGAADGEFILVSGYPGSTARLLTVSQLTYQRDIGNPLQKKVWELRRKALENYSKKGDEQHRQAWPGMRGFANSLKRLEGQQDGLLNPRNYGQKVAEEKDLRDKLAAKPELDKQFAPAWKNIGDAYAKLPAMANRLAFSNISASRLASIAQQLVTYSIEAAKPNDLRYPEFRDTRLEAIKSSLASPAPIYLDMEEASLLFWMEEAVKTLGVNDSFVKAAIGNAEPSEVVKRAIRETKLNDPAARLALFDGGAAAIAASTDPMCIGSACRAGIASSANGTKDDTECRNRQRHDIAKHALLCTVRRCQTPIRRSIEYGKVPATKIRLVPYKTTFFDSMTVHLAFEKSFDSPRAKGTQDKIVFHTTELCIF